MEIHVQHFAAQRMVLNLLHQSQPLGPGIVLDRQVHQQVLRKGMVNQILHLLGTDFQILGLGLPAVNDGRDSPCGAQFFGPGAASQRPRECVQCYRFHVLNSSRPARFY